MSVAMLGRNMRLTNRKKPMTKDKIVNITKCKGSFTTTPQWRNDKIRKWCFELIKAGILEKSPRYDKYKNIEFVLAAPVNHLAGE
jgi:hypothetical protein